MEIIAFFQTLRHCRVVVVDNIITVLPVGLEELDPML
jgi:hypothetical protein